MSSKSEIIEVLRADAAAIEAEIARLERIRRWIVRNHAATAATPLQPAVEPVPVFGNAATESDGDQNEYDVVF